MKNLYKLISKTPNYIRRFGLFSGLRLLFQIEGLKQRPQKSTVLRQYRVPGVIHPVFLRDCVGDHATFWQCLVMNQYEMRNFPQFKRVKEKYLIETEDSPRPLIIDCGGNIGLSCIWFANAFPTARIFVVEPEDQNFLILKENIKNYKNITPLKGGVWNSAGFLKITNPDAGPASFRLESVAGESTDNTLRCYTINEICEIANDAHPFIVKLDIEGAQKKLFASNTDWVNKADIITLELDDWLLPWQGTSKAFFKCLSQYNFEYLLSGESIFCFRDANSGD